MRFKVNIDVEWWNVMSDEYQSCKEDRFVNAVSRKHALDKAIKIGKEWNCYKDRADDPVFRLQLEATII